MRGLPKDRSVQFLSDSLFQLPLEMSLRQSNHKLVPEQCEVATESASCLSVLCEVVPVRRSDCKKAPSGEQGQTREPTPRNRNVIFS